MRVAITGMGGELGTRVATLLEQHDEFTEIMGVDIEPPRRHLDRTDFHRVDPRNRTRMLDVIGGFAPQLLVHVGVYEPNARSSPRSAATRTIAGTVAALDAARAGGALERVVMRSGIEVYGRGSDTPVRPDESVRPDPTSPFGQSLLHAERVVLTGAARVDATVALLRFAPVVGPHFPSPLVRLLRLPAVPVPAFGGGAFCVVHREDAATGLRRRRPASRHRRPRQRRGAGLGERVGRRAHGREASRAGVRPRVERCSHGHASCRGPLCPTTSSSCW